MVDSNNLTDEIYIFQQPVVVIVCFLRQSHRMNRKKDSFSSSFSNLSKQQKSILQQYKRLSFGQESIFYSSESLTFQDIPLFIPHEIRNPYHKCLYLENYLFFEMFTFAIFQHLLVTSTKERKNKTLFKLKKDICSEDFLTGSGYIKGLLMKGLKLMYDKSSQENSNQPIASILLKSECLSAFNECWKEILSKKSKEVNTEDPSNVFFLIFSEYFEISFKLFWKEKQNYRTEAIRQTKTNEQLSIILISSHAFIDNSTSKRDDPENKPVDQFSQISSIYGNWNYYLLFKDKEEIIEIPAQQSNSRKTSESSPRRIKKLNTLQIEMKELFSQEAPEKAIKKSTFTKQKESLLNGGRNLVQNSSDQERRQNILSFLNTKRQGNRLLSEMKLFLDELTNHEE